MVTIYRNIPMQITTHDPTYLRTFLQTSTQHAVTPAPRTPAQPPVQRLITAVNKCVRILFLWYVFSTFCYFRNTISPVHTPSVGTPDVLYPDLNKQDMSGTGSCWVDVRQFLLCNFCSSFHEINSYVCQQASSSCWATEGHVSCGCRTRPAEDSDLNDLMPDGCARVTPSSVITGLHTKQSQTLPTYCILLIMLKFSVMQPPIQISQCISEVSGRLKLVSW